MNCDASLDREEARRIIGENGGVKFCKIELLLNEADESVYCATILLLYNALCNAVDEISLAYARTKNRIIHRSRTWF